MDSKTDDTPVAAEVVKPKIGAYRRHLLICTGPRCTQQGESQALFDGLGEKFKAAGLDQGELRVKRSRVSCFAACKGGPVMCVQPDGTWYYNVTPKNMDRMRRRGGAGPGVPSRAGRLSRVFHGDERFYLDA